MILEKLNYTVQGNIVDCDIVKKKKQGDITVKLGSVRVVLKNDGSGNVMVQAEEFWVQVFSHQGWHWCG